MVHLTPTKKKKRSSKTLFDVQHAPPCLVEDILNQKVPNPNLVRLPIAQLKLMEGLEALEKANEAFYVVNDDVTRMEF